MALQLIGQGPSLCNIIAVLQITAFVNTVLYEAYHTYAMILISAHACPFEVVCHVLCKHM